MGAMLWARGRDAAGMGQGTVGRGQGRSMAQGQGGNGGMRWAWDRDAVGTGEGRGGHKEMDAVGTGEGHGEHGAGTGWAPGDVVGTGEGRGGHGQAVALTEPGLLIALHLDGEAEVGQLHRRPFALAGQEQVLRLPRAAPGMG